MNRSNFLKLSAAAFAGTSFALKVWETSSIIQKQIKELGEHKIDKCEIVELAFHWPRLVGKNGRLDIHGQNKKVKVLKLYTNHGQCDGDLRFKRQRSFFQSCKTKKFQN